MDDIAAEVAASPCLRSLAEQLARMEWDDIKEMSRPGVVYRGRRQVDAGNFAYALLYQMLLGRLTGEPLHPLWSLGERFSPLCVYRGFDTTHGIGMQGDVIECLLSVIRETGPAVPVPLARARTLCHTRIRSFVDRCLQLRAVIEEGVGVQVNSHSWPCELISWGITP